MARYAYVFGSNGPANYDPLKYALQDAENIRTVLSNPRCGFEVHVPPPDSDTFDIRRQITTIADSCNYEDVFVCYFSGHGTAPVGSLMLLWDNTDLNRLMSSAIPAADILETIKHCKAHNKLLILDCCRAGAIERLLGTKNIEDLSLENLEIKPDNYLVLMASDRLEKARELDELESSFLASNICLALTEKFSEVDQDRDNRISVQELRNWLEKQAFKHNQKSPAFAVPIPYLVGRERGSFFLASTEESKPYIKSSKRHNEALKSSIVSVVDKEERIRGMGFLVTQKLILTASYVINAILNDRKPILRQEGEADVIFPFLEKEKIRVEVKKSVGMFTLNDQVYGVTLLKIKNPLPLNAQPIQLLPDEIQPGRACVTFSISSDKTFVWTSHSIQDELPSGLWQLEGLAPSGGGGTPVWSERDNAVVGMLISINSKYNKSYMLPADVISKILIENAEEN